MQELEHRRRPIPERTGPIRSWTELLRRAERPGAPDSPPSHQPEESADAAAGDGAPGAVNLAYRVIEDYMHEGQATAERTVKDARHGGRAEGSFQALSERLLGDALVWLEHAAKLWGRFDPPDAPSPTPRQDSAPAGSTVFRAHVRSSAPVEIRLDLDSGAAGRPLGVHGLRCQDPAAPTIDGATLAPVDDTGIYRISVSVPEGQPAGGYSGVVYDTRDGSVQGTLAVCVERPIYGSEGTTA